MQDYTFSWEVKDILTQFLQAFDGAIVKRRDRFGNVGNNIAARYVYAPKQRVLDDLVNKSQHITLPVVSFWINSISRDPKRVFSKLDGDFYNAKAFDNKTTHVLQPVPVDINISVSMMTRFQSDMDQIISNFVPYCDPYFVISWTRSGFRDIEVRTPVEWNNNLDITSPIEQTAEQPARVICDTGFLIKGWLFKANADPVGRIYKINTNFYGVSGTPTLANISNITSPDYTDVVTLTATPRITFCSRWMSPIDYATTASVKGSNFLTITNVFLSGSDPAMFSGPTTVDLFSATSLSATYPALENVVPIQLFSAIDDNNAAVTFQAPQYGGFFDIIVANPAGYTLMTQTVTELNLTPSPPYIDGVEVVGTFNYTWENATITWDEATFQWQVA